MRHILFWEVAWCSLQPVDDVSRHLSVTCSRVNSARRIHSLTVWRLVPTTILHHVTSQKSEGLNYSAAELLHYHVTQCYTMLHKNRGLWISYRGLVVVSHPAKHPCLHGSFVNAAGIWDYTASYAKTVNMNWIGCWKKWLWPGWWCYQEISTESKEVSVLKRKVENNYICV
jgi:hypothetical protein